MCITKPPNSLQPWKHGHVGNSNMPLKKLIFKGVH